MRVYYYTDEHFAISNIEHKRIKISRLDELNDPFEFLGADLGNREFRASFNTARKAVAEKFGLISFSKDWGHPLMWAHYGKKHYGVCLGFDIEDIYLKEVDYYSDRLPFEFDMEKKNGKLTSNDIEKLLCAKYKAWDYEQEMRVVVPLEEPEKSGLYFSEFNRNMLLKEVILGPRCTLEPNDLADVLCSFDNDVTVFKTRIAFKSFRVVKNETKRVYEHRVRQSV